MTLEETTIETPIGAITIVARGDALVGAEFTDGLDRSAWLRRRLGQWFGECGFRDRKDPAGASARLRAYFAGDLAALRGQPVEMHGTDFQRRVWEALREIPAGCTESYGALARRIGAPTAIRAVGAANGSNPVGIFVPCHRVIAANGSLHGYGGGLDRKAWLLRHEGATFRDEAGRTSPERRSSLFAP